MQDNLKSVKKINVPICQDTGMAVLFFEIGQDIHFTNGNFEEAVNEGVRLAYKDGYMRKSVVKDPLIRVNTDDNTPAVIYTKLVPGDKVKITALPKGFGSENKSMIKMFNPTAKKEDIIDFVCDCVKNAGSSACPPVILGIGIGGTFDYCAYLSKLALTKDITKPNPNPYYAQMESEILNRLNQLNIGCQGFGGDITALGVNIEYYPTHIASLPVAVNISCHVTRHMSIEL